MIDNDLLNYVNLDSYTESNNYVGYVELPTSANSIETNDISSLAEYLLEYCDDDFCFYSSLYIDERLKDHVYDYGLNKNQYESFLIPLIKCSIVREGDYENWSEDDRELLDFNVFDDLPNSVITLDNLFRLLYLYLVCEHYLLYGYAFFVGNDFTFYLSDEGIGCVYFNDEGLNLSKTFLNKLALRMDASVRLLHKN